MENPMAPGLLGAFAMTQNETPGRAPQVYEELSEESLEIDWDEDITVPDVRRHVLEEDAKITPSP